jgi:hypothetical protein
MTTHLQDVLPPAPPWSRLWEKEGLFYAELADPSSGEPLCVVLHGITNLQQATEAVSLLAPSAASCRTSDTAAIVS